MDSTLLESREMRAGVGQQAPISSRLYNTRQRVRHGGLKSPRNPERSGSIRQYDSHIRMMGFVRRPTGNGLVVGGETRPWLPGFRKTGHARRVSCELTADGGSIPPASKPKEGFRWEHID